MAEALIAARELGYPVVMKGMSRISAGSSTERVGMPAFVRLKSLPPGRSHMAGGSPRR
ncbi:MAG: hypothetical protein ACYC5Q_15910 [Thermoleophilia bacterium]